MYVVMYVGRCHDVCKSCVMMMMMTLFMTLGGWVGGARAALQAVLLQCCLSSVLSVGCGAVVLWCCGDAAILAEWLLQLVLVDLDGATKLTAFLLEIGNLYCSLAWQIFPRACVLVLALALALVAVALPCCVSAFCVQTSFTQHPNTCFGGGVLQRWPRRKMHRNNNKKRTFFVVASVDFLHCSPSINWPNRVSYPPVASCSLHVDAVRANGLAPHCARLLSAPFPGLSCCGRQHQHSHRWTTRVWKGNHVGKVQGRFRLRVTQQRGRFPRAHRRRSVAPPIHASARPSALLA